MRIARVMKMKGLSAFYLVIVMSTILINCISGCANIIPPAGGPRDSIPPVLIAATPKDSATNFTGSRVNLSFNEFVEINNAFENVLVSPTPNNVPNITYHFRDVTVRIKDTLEPNTTYSINFGNALRDVNEGNVSKNFTYVFSTGRTIAQNTISGKVIMAETGKVDSTLIVVLHRNLEDSAVAKEKPRYIAKLDGQGNFVFRYLPAGTFALYAIPNDFSHHYDDTTKPFAFADSAINTTQTSPLTLYAYQLAKRDTALTKISKPTNGNPKNNKKQDKPLLKFQNNLQSGKQDLLDSLDLTFSQPIKKFDTSKIILANKDFTRATNYTIVADTNKTRFSIVHNWTADTDFKLLISKDAFTDTTGLTLVKNDTVSFTTKREEDYGSIKLRFRNIDLTKNPVLQIFQNDRIIESIMLTGPEWSRKLFNPGDYDLRILYDNNKNGKWDPGRFFSIHKQPEIVVPINTKLSIRGNWDNQREITL